jgi:large subunit ribosomal protein L1
MARLRITSAVRPLAAPFRHTAAFPAATQLRYASVKKKTGGKAGSKKTERNKVSKELKSYDPTEYPQFSLCDALRYALHRLRLEEPRWPLSRSE